MRAAVRRFFGLLASTRLAFVLIGLVLVHVVAAAVIPQEGVEQVFVVDQLDHGEGLSGLFHDLRLDRIYTAPPFHVLLGLLALNLALGNVNRFRTVYRVEKTLLRLRHMGSIIFHLGLLAVLLGALFNYAFKFHGVFALTEGQTAGDTPAGFFRTFQGPLAEPSYGRYTLTAESITEERDEAGEKVQKAVIRLREDNVLETRQQIAFGRPVRFSDVELHLGRRVGYSPEILVRDGDQGRIVFRSFVRLVAAEHEGQDVHSDFVDLPVGMRAQISVELEDGEEPFVWVAMERGDEKLGEGKVGDADSLVVDNWTVRAPRLRRWAFLEARTNPGIGVVFAGFWVALGGLSLTLLARVVPNRRRRA